MKFKILCTDGFSKSGRSFLESNSNFEIVYHEALTHQELLDKIEPFHALVVRSASKVGHDVIEKAKHLKIIVRAGVGIDNVDVKAATEHGISVANAPAGNSISTAELTFGMILSLARHIPQSSAAMSKGNWEKKKFKGTELAGKTLGIIGLGRVGREVAKMAQCFRMKVIGFDPYLSKEIMAELGIVPATLETLFKTSDFITVHTTLTKETENLISLNEMKTMKPTVRLINCARGGIINEADLAHALKEKMIAGAALDVFTSEPFEKPIFRELENCITTPHLGASTSEAQEAVAIEAANVVKGFLTDGTRLNVVN